MTCSAEKTVHLLYKNAETLLCCLQNGGWGCRPTEGEGEVEYLGVVMAAGVGERVEGVEKAISEVINTLVSIHPSVKTLLYHHLIAQYGAKQI